MPSEVRSTCCYCGVGCGVLIEVEDGRISGVRGDPEHPANHGRLCTKGASLHLTLNPGARLQFPEHRPVRGQAGTRLSWDAALDLAAGRFAEIIRRHGPDSVAFYISGQLLTEDYYVFNKLAKGLIGTNNIDSNSRLCMSSAVSGYKQTLGTDAPPCCYDDIAAAGTLLVAGANPAVAHPILFRRIEDARAANPDLRLIVADPRRSETAASADLHLAIRPGSDIALFNGLLHLLIAEARIDREFIAAHTRGFDYLAAIVRHYTPERVARICDIPVQHLHRAARWFSSNGPALSLYCQGLNQSAHGTHNNAALIHLHLATGQIGRPGSGPFSLTGQPNAMGGREVGGMANLLPAHRDLSDPRDRAEIARFWGVPKISARPGKTAVDLVQALKTGEIKAVWIACTNPAHSLPNQPAVRAALAAAEFVVLQEAYAHTDTADWADLILPASAWGEKDGTVTNSERRISRVCTAVPPPGEARHDWQIAVDFAHRLGPALGRHDAARLFPHTHPEALFNEHRESTRGRDLDITGLSYALLEQAGPQHWPYPEGARGGLPRLYADGRFPTRDGRARFIAVQHQELADPGSRHGGTPSLSLISGRMRDHWHGMSRTGTVPRLFNLEDEARISLHPDDLAIRGLKAGDLAEIRNARGSLRARVAADTGLRHGEAWMPMHWGSQFMNSPGVNAITCDTTDPHSHQPELKHASVTLRRLDLPWPLVIIRRCADVAEALALRQLLQPRLSAFPYATVSLYGRQSPLVVFRAALGEALPAERLAELDTLFGLTDDPTAIQYSDAARQVFKKAQREGNALRAVRLAGEARAEAWLRQAIAENELDPGQFSLMLAPVSARPLSAPPRHIVCKCADVTDRDILAQRDTDLAGVQERLKCGTYCGGCLPDIRRLLADAGSKPAATAQPATS